MHLKIFALDPVLFAQLSTIFPAAGYVAVSMGLPVELVACVNTNDIIHRALENGDYTPGLCAQTWAVAMDIQVGARAILIMKN